MPTGIHVDFLCTHRRDRQYQKSHPQKTSVLMYIKKHPFVRQIIFLENFFTHPKFYNIDYQYINFYFGKLHKQLRSSDVFIW